MWLDARQRREVKPAEVTEEDLPIPTRMVSNGEFMPIAQTQAQRRVEQELGQIADDAGRKLGMSRRDFLRSSAGMAAAFWAMNKVFGDFFGEAQAESLDPDQANASRQRLRDQFIVDVQLHFIRDNYNNEIVLALGEYAKRWNPVLEKEGITFDRYKFDHFLKEVYFDSDTKIGLVSAAPSEDSENVIVGNAGLAEARRLVNAAAGSRRLLCHSVIAPGQPGWMDQIDEAIEVHKPNGWKGYTVGDPFEVSKSPYRLDDEKLMYPAYDKMEKAGIRTVCIHKGLLPEDYKRHFQTWPYAKVDDVGPAARDWPNLNFVIYHSGFRPLLTSPEPLLREFEATGRIDWVTDLAEIPGQYGVDNVYAELGTTFGSCCTTHPKLAAAILGTVVRGMGADHVIWGTDSVWYGSPQWQIEAMRRIEIPQEMQKAHGFKPLGTATGPVKTAIFADNAVRVFRLQKEQQEQPWRKDALAAAVSEYLAAGAAPSNKYYGFIRATAGKIE